MFCGVFGVYCLHTPLSARALIFIRCNFPGYLMSKFAKVSCSLGHQELDLFYYSVECDQLTKWAESDQDLKEVRIKEVGSPIRGKQ